MTARAGTERVRQLAGSVALLRPRSQEHEALVGHFLGMLYSLIEAFKLGYVDRTGAMVPREYSNELSRVARSLQQGKAPRDRQWVAGFYFNSALYRAGALAERVGKAAGQNRRLVKDVSDEVKRLKHDVEGVLLGRTVAPGRLVEASKRIGEALASMVANPTK